MMLQPVLLWYCCDLVSFRYIDVIYFKFCYVLLHYELICFMKKDVVLVMLSQLYDAVEMNQ